jgi:quercetin dioxygenase-like cupin family protein
VYHLWIAMEGTLEISVGGAPPVAARSGQAIFMVKGTAHGFKNVGNSPAAALEIFIKTVTTAANPLLWDSLAQLNVPLPPGAISGAPR